MYSKPDILNPSTSPQNIHFWRGFYCRSAWNYFRGVYSSIIIPPLSFKNMFSQYDASLKLWLFFYLNILFLLRGNLMNFFVHIIPIYLYIFIIIINNHATDNVFEVWTHPREPIIDLLTLTQLHIYLSIYLGLKFEHTPENL